MNWIKMEDEIALHTFGCLSVCVTVGIKFLLRSLVRSYKNGKMPGGSRAKYWCFTLNNFTPNDEERLKAAFENDAFNITYLVYGKETGESGTPHLQGFVAFSDRTRFNAVVSRLGQCHLTVARRIANAIEYCKKDGDVVEYGDLPVNTQGTRTDLEAFKDAVKSGITDTKVLREEHSEVWARYRAFCVEYLADKAERYVRPEHALRPWQADLKAILQLPADDRCINFVVDETGNTGKSWFAHKLKDWFDESKVQIMQPGKKADMAYALQMNLNILVLDAPRSKQGEYIQYDFLEDVKNGAVFSGKYESRTKEFKPPHVVVMMNEMPDMEKLSADRYNIINI